MFKLLGKKIFTILHSKMFPIFTYVSLYLQEDTFESATGQTAVSEEPEDYFDKYGITGEDGEDAEAWEREARKLYEWTQELSFNDDFIGTPRLVTSGI